MSDKTGSQVRQVRAGEELNEGPLKSFLADQGLIEDPQAPLEVGQFSNGYSNLTYQLSVEGKQFVLRRPPFGAVKRGHDMGREYKVLSRLYKQFPQSPRALCYTEDEGILGCPFYIMEKVDGIILSFKEAKKHEVDFEKVSRHWLSTFVQLHQVDYKAAGLEDLGKPAGYVERQVTNWGKQFLKAATEEVPEADQLMKWMGENQPTTYGHALIHNDYKYDNVVFKDDSWDEISAVLDWEMCTLGDPLMDLGTTLAYWTTADDNPIMKAGLPSATQLPGNPTREALVEAYALKSGKPVDHLVFYYAFGLFKIAVIAQQIYYRYKQGLTRDERFANLNQSARLLCMLGLNAAQKGRISDLL